MNCVPPLIQMHPSDHYFDTSQVPQVVDKMALRGIPEMG
jgi:hypothetical protein